MDLPTITEDKVLEVLTKEWQPIKSLIFKLKIKDMMIARSLQTTLKNLEFQKKVSTRLLKGKRFWKLCDKELNNLSQSNEINEEIKLLNEKLDDKALNKHYHVKTQEKIINLSKIEIINEEIKLLREKLDFLVKLENLIKNGATGYELAYEIKEYRNTVRKKINEIENDNMIEIEDDVYDEIKQVYLDLDILKKVGNNKILDFEEILKHNFSRNIGNKCIEEIKRERVSLINEIGYLEFLKQKPKPKEIKEKIDYEKDLDDFIGFLDEKYKEWEKIKSGKKD